MEKFVTVCSPVDLKKSSEYVQQGVKRMFDIYYSYELKKLLRKQKINNPDKKFPEMRGVYSVIGFDTVFTARHAGYDNVEDYYQDCSPILRMREIEHNIEMIFAKDDPLISEGCLAKIPRNSQTIELNIQESGGHLGFYSDVPTRFNDNRWLDAYLFRTAENLFKRRDPILLREAA